MKTEERCRLSELHSGDADGRNHEDFQFKARVEARVEQKMNSRRKIKFKLKNTIFKVGILA